MHKFIGQFSSLRCRTKFQRSFKTKQPGGMFRFGEQTFCLPLTVRFLASINKYRSCFVPLSLPSSPFSSTLSGFDGSGVFVKGLRFFFLSERKRFLRFSVL